MFTLWFMGRPASGKSTLAAQVERELVEEGHPIENLDGDEVRKNLHPELGFTKEDRAINNRRTAFIAKLLNHNGINAIVAMITPFREAQRQAREIIAEEGEFVLIYVKTPLEVCERRDPKGMYDQARDGKIDNFTGISHPFQEPIDPEIIVETADRDVEECVEHIMSRLAELGVLEEPIERNGFSLTPSEYQRIIDDLQDSGHIQ
ncbi:MAG: adenylyl-sulfate kinase [Haloferacaceae archaeon]